MDKKDKEKEGMEVEVKEAPILTFASLASKKEKSKHLNTAKEATKLVRIRLSSNNPYKRALKGEIFTARNAVIEEIKKFVPFNVPTHVPQILLNVIKEKQYQSFYSEKNTQGMTNSKSRLLPEYNVEILPNLTAEEFNAIKQKQLAEQSVIE